MRKRSEEGERERGGEGKQREAGRERYDRDRVLGIRTEEEGDSGKNRELKGKGREGQRREGEGDKGRRQEGRNKGGVMEGALRQNKGEAEGRGHGEK